MPYRHSICATKSSQNGGAGTVTTATIRKSGVHMALEQRDRIIERGNGRTPGTMPTREPSIGELFGQLSSDASRLIQSEVALAKAELRETTSMLVKDAAKVGVA